MSKINTGCTKCDRRMIDEGRMCPKHELEMLKHYAEIAQKEYEEAKAEYEKNKNPN